MASSKYKKQIPGISFSSVSTPDDMRTDRSCKHKNISRAIVLLTGLAGIFYFYNGTIDGVWDADLIPTSQPAQALCPQANELFPEKNHLLWNEVSAQLSSDEFKEQAIAWLGGAIRIPTESYDEMDPVGIDPRWEQFAPFHEYLEKSFPLIHSNLNQKKVNTYGLIYEWEGYNSTLKPILLTAHQDVVPVEPTTVDEWVHPPYSGFFDGDRLWGRGSSDDKNGLIGTMSAIETLLKSKFKPSRKVVLAFGFDEESSGLQGAHELSKYLEATYGENAFAMLADEGDGFSKQYGSVFAILAIGEKGYFDTHIEVTSPGGHSSIPPTHTSIGILSALLVAYESNPIKPVIDRGTPIYDMMQCMAQHGPDMDNTLRKAILKSASSDKALHRLEELIAKDREFSSSIGTTQAIDLIQGGVKTNALPEQAWAVVNHRIATQSSVAAVKDRDTEVLVELVERFNLTYNAFGQTLRAGSSGSLVLTDAWGTALEPAPITPTDAAPYKLLSGTIRATYNSHRAFKDVDEIKIAPGIMAGNTDTCFYWKLTKHIYRYNHQSLLNEGKIPGGIHTINESIGIEDFLEMIRFFVTLILNADEYEL